MNSGPRNLRVGGIRVAAPHAATVRHTGYVEGNSISNRLPEARQPSRVWLETTVCDLFGSTHDSNAEVANSWPSVGTVCTTKKRRAFWPTAPSQNVTRLRR